jgi:dTDP-glucose 4,6-dehydratase
LSHIFVTGGAGFIGANFVLNWLAQPGADGVVNVDKLTYAGNRKTLSSLDGDTRHVFSQTDICDRDLDRLLTEYKPRAVVHFAAESHVDRSIHGPAEFIQTNIVGTFTLLEAVRAYWSGLEGSARDFRFCTFPLMRYSVRSVQPIRNSLKLPRTRRTARIPLRRRLRPPGPRLSPHVWSAGPDDQLLQQLRPVSLPEKLIPLMITNALTGKPLPVYGDGQNVRDWLYVGDHCSAIREVLALGRLGETYNVAAGTR